MSSLTGIVQSTGQIPGRNDILSSFTKLAKYGIAAIAVFAAALGILLGAGQTAYALDGGDISAEDDVGDPGPFRPGGDILILIDEE